jgi:flagellar biosynthesis GTPase FlhF
MSNYESKLHKPGVKIYRAKGDLVADDVEKWREELIAFIKENNERGACGILLDTLEVESFSAEALDTLMELLSEPEDVIDNIRMRFALIGVRPFTQRFLREAMSQITLKHIRARFFHEVAEDEALAWLGAMVSSADELPDTRDVKEEKEKEKEKEEGKKKVEEKKAEEKKKDEEKIETKAEQEKKEKKEETKKPEAPPKKDKVATASKEKVSARPSLGSILSRPKDKTDKK